MAARAIKMIAIPPTITALVMMQSSDIPDLVERASSAHRWIALGYIASLLLAALFSYLLWASGNKVQDALRTDADARIAQVKSDGETAKRESGQKIAELNKQAEGLRSEAESARKDIAAAQVEVAKASERAANAERETARLNKIAEEERLARVKIEDRLRPRRLSQQQREAIRGAVSAFRGTEVHLTTVVSDSDGSQYAKDFEDVLSQARWHITSSAAGVFVAPLPVGVVIQVGDAHNPAAVALQQVLRAQGIDAGGSLVAGMEPGTVGLLVGIKP
jgi:hypothetical protein